MVNVICITSFKLC